MHSRSRRPRATRARGWLLTLIGLSSVVLAAPGYPDDVLAARASADVVLVRENEVVGEDLYAGGNTITIEGTIEGDLVVWAFDRLDMSGTVQGDVGGLRPADRIRRGAGRGGR